MKKKETKSKAKQVKREVICHNQKDFDKAMKKLEKGEITAIHCR
jgi:hypothetical protein